MKSVFIYSSVRSHLPFRRLVAELYNLSPYDMVTVHVAKKEDEAAMLKEVSADFVTVTIKDQHVSRGEMQLFQESLVGRWIYEGQRLGQSKQVKDPSMSFVS